MKITERLAEHIVGVDYEQLPSKVVAKTKLQILDTLGIMLPPSTLEKTCIALEQICREGGGREESTIVGFGGRLPCWMAAFLNGSLCHSMDYDDTIDEFVNHPSAHTLPAGLAVAEKVGLVSGKEFITAVALGVDLNVRLSAAPRGSAGVDYPWVPMTMFGVFSATAAAGRLLGLSVPEMINAFGIALDRVSGTSESSLSPDSELRAIRDGFGNKEGVIAALMAKKGINACKEAFEILYRVYYSNDFRPSLLTSNLGTEFSGLKVSLKVWPCCRATHTYIKAGLDIVTQYDIAPTRIKEILLTVGKFGRDFLFNPLEAKQKPEHSINAKVSLPFIMGLVFAKRRVVIEDFFAENLDDPEVLEIAEKTKYKFDPHLSENAIGAGVVKVTMDGGGSMEKREEVPYGHPENPMSESELLEKFKDCAQFSKRKFSDKELAELTEKILNIEMVKDIKELTKYLM